MKADQLMVPVYINEKIVLDMLAIIEDGNIGNCGCDQAVGAFMLLPVNGDYQ